MEPVISRPPTVLRPTASQDPVWVAQRFRLAALDCSPFPLRCPGSVNVSLAASRFPVSTQFVFTDCLFFSRITVPIGFFCGGFSSTAGYVPGNEAHLAMSDFRSPFWWFLAKKCFPFLSGKPEKVFQPFLEPSLSASVQGVIVTFFRLLLLSNSASPLRSPLLVPVKKPVSV
jgi:hypothetical protein